MTTGTKISDDRYYSATNLPWAPYQLIGRRFSKLWSGGDRSGTEIQTGEVIEHAYQCSIKQSEFTQAHVTSNEGDNYHWSTEAWVPGGIEAPWTNNDDLRLLTKLGTRARDSEFNGGNFLAEFHQVPKLLANLAHKGAAFLECARANNHKLMNRIVRGDTVSLDYTIARMKANMKNIGSDDITHGINNTAEKMGEFLLMYDYGVSPLVSDASTSMNALSQTLNDFEYRTVVRVSRKKFTSDVAPGSFGGWQRRAIRTDTIRGYLNSPPDTTTIWHLNDPLSAGVEVTPWSFVVDWVIPVSSYFSALDTIRSFDWSSMWKTSTIRTFILWPPNTKTEVSGSETTQYEGGIGTVKTVTVTRVAMSLASTALPPCPVIRPASETLSVKHMLDAAALAVAQKTRIAKSLKF